MIRNSPARRIVATITLVPFLAACHTQRPLGVSLPAPSTRIIAQITDTGSIAMANMIGVAAHEITGIVAEADVNTWKVQLTRVDHRGGSSSRWNRETVAFPRYALTNVRETKLDRKRSWIVAGIAAGAVVAVTLLFGSVLGGSTGEGEPIPPPA